MDAIETEVLDGGVKQDAKGRRILPEQEWMRVLDEYDRSGMTQKAFARREGINLHTLVAWLGRRRKGARGADNKPARFHEVDLRSAVPGQLEIHLADGVVLKGSSPEGLAALYSALGR